MIRKYPHVKLILLALTAACTAVSQEKAGPAEPAASASQTEPGQPFDVQGDYAASHILVSYEGASRAKPEVKRTKEEALIKAQQLAARLKEEPGLFEDMAKLESDGPSAPRGGDLNSWKKGGMVPAFETTVESLAFGEIAAEPVETQFGFHIIRRNSLARRHFGGYGFFVGFKGSAQSPPTVTREKAEAEALAKEIAAKLNDGNFDELAKEHNDFGDSAMFLGAIPEDAPLPNGMDAVLTTLKGLDFGKVSGPVELPMAYAFFKRVKLEQRTGAHILIAYQGAERANSDVTRTKEEALAMAKEIQAKAAATPDTFSDLAKEHSDGPSKVRGGDLGIWFRGGMVPEFDTAIDGLEPGQITAEPVETSFGFHIIKRGTTEKGS